jgi:hypothetical protein
MADCFRFPMDLGMEGFKDLPEDEGAADVGGSASGVAIAEEKDDDDVCIE